MRIALLAAGYTAGFAILYLLLYRTGYFPTVAGVLGATGALSLLLLWWAGRTAGSAAAAVPSDADILDSHRYRLLFEAAPIGIALVDDRHRIAACNAAFRSLVASEDPVGRPVGDFVAAAEREAVWGWLDAALRGETVATPMQASIAGGAAAAVAIYLLRQGERPLRSEPDASPQLVLHFVDVTEQKRLEMQFTQSQKMQAVGQLAGGIAHDFNNLLTAMIGFCDLLLQRFRPGEQAFADIMQIKQNANRGASLVRQLLAFSRQQTQQPRVLVVTDVLAELSNLLRRLLGQNAELEMIHGRDLGRVRVDLGQLEQVIINLAVNARDAMPRGGKLTIRTANRTVAEGERIGPATPPPGDYVGIAVSDTGMGIPKENLGRIFDPFFTTKEVGSGTGLGLSTVYGIVKQAGGFVFAESEGEGRGATFTIYLSRHRGPVEDADAADDGERAADLTGGGTVLLVEDEDPVRLFAARALRSKGYRVVEARTGEAALELLQRSAFDLLITDMVMPTVDGAAVIHAARARRSDLPVICISGYTQESIAKEVEAIPNLHFLAKPFSLKQLAGKVKELLE